MVTYKHDARILVTGSRYWTDEDFIANVLLYDIEVQFSQATLVHGAARGADTIAGRIWKSWGSEVEPHPADWRRHGRAAGLLRNAAMVALGADLCLAFIRDDSPGATGCALMAEKAGIPVRYYHRYGADL
jgi:hypothetical protein